MTLKGIEYFLKFRGRKSRQAMAGPATTAVNIAYTRKARKSRVLSLQCRLAFDKVWFE